MDTKRPGQVVFTNKARCQDCLRCIRYCPVKAIRMQGGQAFVVEDRCIVCGTCVRECPQGAKTFQNDVDRSARLTESAGPVVISVAPSFAAVYSESQRRRLPSALRKLGFSYVAETSVAAFAVSELSALHANSAPEQSHIFSACPAVVSFLEKYRPTLVGSLVPIVSPMILHARALKQRFGKACRFVFVGPCIAKKAEAARPEHRGLVDSVLTFSELNQWLDSRGISLDSLEESDFDDAPIGDSRYYPLPGGALRTASLPFDGFGDRIVEASGFDQVVDALDSMGRAGESTLLEALFCSQGCIHGPAIPENDGVHDRRRKLIRYVKDSGRIDPPPCTIAVAASTSFQALPVDVEEITEDQIRRTLEKTGKAKTEDQLNCGACGYGTCREKAIAVIRNMADLEVCLPYMRRLAERRTDKIIETSPNGIVVLDERLQILSMNPAFRRYFLCTEAVYGKRISCLMDPEPFERLVTGSGDLLELTINHERYGIVCHQVLYSLPEDKQYVGIFVNITSTLAHQKKLEQLRTQTILQARELLDHQISMAQELAQFLGEQTARGEDLVESLVKLTVDKADGGREAANSLVWDARTSK